MIAITMDIKLSRKSIEALPNYKKRGAKEWSSACPNCGGDPAMDTDRFRYWPDTGNYWCRQCGMSGFISDTSLFTATPEMKAKWEAQKAEQDRNERERRRTAIESIQAKRNDLVYHRQLLDSPEFMQWVQATWGIGVELVEAFHIGWCRYCPTFPDSDSITIPFYDNGRLVNLRHRLIRANDKGKYRPELAGLESSIFNVDVLSTPAEMVILVEGELKTVYLSQYYNTVGISGITQFKPEWGKQFNSVQTVYVCFDPGADEAAHRTGQMLAKAGNEVVIVDLPHKPDDFFHLFKGSQLSFNKFLRCGRRL
jgi:predicted RNA-binding Zn-ribbon protein involved in translation (DUF1610 family)